MFSQNDGVGHELIFSVQTDYIKADGLLRIYTDKRIFLGTKIFDRKEIEELLLPDNALSTVFVQAMSEFISVRILAHYLKAKHGFLRLKSTALFVAVFQSL